MEITTPGKNRQSNCQKTRENTRRQKTFARILGITSQQLNYIVNHKPEQNNYLPTIKWWQDPEHPERAKTVFELTGHTLEELLSDDFLDRASRAEKNPRTRSGKRVSQDMIAVLYPNADRNFADQLDLTWQNILNISDLIQPAEHRLGFREINILEYRFGLAGKPEKTLEEIGRIYNVSQKTIRFIRDRALTKIQTYYKPYLLKHLDPLSARTIKNRVKPSSHL